MTSRIPGFYRLSPDDRLVALHERGWVDEAGLAAYRDDGLGLRAADLMVENVVGLYAMPNAVAVNLCINGEDRVVPMVMEEPSVVAAVSNMAQLTRKAGGLTAEADPSLMIGQVQVLDIGGETASQLRAARATLVDVAAAVHPRLVARGGGLRDVYVREIQYDEPGETPVPMVVVEFVLDCCDAMGANMVNTVAEHLAPHVEAITGARVGLRILSNLASRRLARASCAVPVALLGTDAMDGRDVAAGIVSAYRFAYADPYRAATHNKGVMNGIDAVVVATGNDWRAVEAGAHAYAARDGRYRPLTRWRLVEDVLHGEIEVPLQLGTVGGPIRVHPTARANLAMLGDRGARDLSAVTASIGLVQNLGALRALSTEGIQAGHMRMHARNVAASAGARPEEIGPVVEALCARKDFSLDAAKAVIVDLRAA